MTKNWDHSVLNNSQDEDFWNSITYLQSVASDLPADVSYEQSVTSDLPAVVSYEQSDFGSTCRRVV